MSSYRLFFEGVLSSRATIVSGHALLVQSALKSAQGSTFECHGCTDGATSHLVTYSFRLETGAGWPCVDDENPNLTLSANRVIITAQEMPLHLYFSNVSAKSLKCLYLWTCGSKWGGEDYYFYKVRSPKCLGMWHCGDRLREPFAMCNRLQRAISRSHRKPTLTSGTILKIPSAVDTLSSGLLFTRA
jgi:hypothetical protein